MEFDDNYGNSIISITHTNEAFVCGDILSSNINMADITTFIYLTNMTDDQVNIEDSTFDSTDSEYIIYATSKLDTTSSNADDMTHINLHDNTFSNCSKSAIMRHQVIKIILIIFIVNIVMMTAKMVI